MSSRALLTYPDGLINNLLIMLNAQSLKEYWSNVYISFIPKDLLIIIFALFMTIKVINIIFKRKVRL